MKCRFINEEEFASLDKKRRKEGLSFLSSFGGGTMWYCPWYHDPNDPSDIADLESGHTRLFLSEHYIRDWARIRPPIMVLCPNGSMWCVDQKSSNGNGWTVTGEIPNITAMPSIVVPGYHGWLKDGEFSEDIEGRGPNGQISS